MPAILPGVNPDIKVLTTATHRSVNRAMVFIGTDYVESQIDFAALR